MKRNGVERWQTNGQGAFGIPARRGERHGGNGEWEIARKIERSIDYMLQRLDQPLHVANLAAAVNFSPSHFSALFKSWTGCPPIDYFIHLRMQHACWLLDNTPLKVREVAAALGYDDPFYFSRTFKSVNRIAPSEYRVMPEKLKDNIPKAALPFVCAVHENGRTVPAMFSRTVQNRPPEPKWEGCAKVATSFRSHVKKPSNPGCSSKP